MIAVDVLLGQAQGAPQLTTILAILDANNLQRNLYLLSQILELGAPVVVALNMADVARSRGLEIDVEALSEELGVPVIPTAADRGEGLAELKEALAQSIDAPAATARVDTADALRAPLEALEKVLAESEATLGRKVTRSEAFRVLIDVEGEFEQRLVRQLGPTFVAKLASIRQQVADPAPLPALEARARYRWIETVVARTMRRPEKPRRTRTDRIDAVLTHRLFGTVGLVVVLGLVFQAIYSWSAPVMDLVDGLFGMLGSGVEATLDPGPLRSLLVDGVIGGVGGVVIFLPQIMVLVLFLAILEDCGYMARAAFLMDRLLVKLGLSGRSVIPLLSSFACAVPGIMAARTIESRRNRLATILVAPLMSCSARLPVYVLMIGAFVPAKGLFGGMLGLQGVVLLGAHLIGVFVAIPILLIFKKTIFKGPTPPFVMELPPYRMPTLRNVLTRLWEQSSAFVVRAGTIIFAVSIVIWALSYYPHPDSIGEHYDTLRAQATSAEEVQALDSEEAGAYLAHSVMGRMGHVCEPVFEPLGWDWRIGVAVVGSFAAREIVVATLGTIFNVGDDVDEESQGLRAVLDRATWPDGRPLFNLPVALSLIVFFALCCQCVSTLAIIKRETGSWGWTIFCFTYMTVLAYVAALLVYQGAMAWGLA